MTDADGEEYEPLSGDDQSDLPSAQAEIEIGARVRADEVRFDAEPHVQVRFPGSGRRDSRQVTTRKNIDKPIRPGETYRDVFVETRISSRLLDDDGVG